MADVLLGTIRKCRQRAFSELGEFFHPKFVLHHAPNSLCARVVCAFAKFDQVIPSCALSHRLEVQGIINRFMEILLKCGSSIESKGTLVLFELAGKGGDISGLQSLETGLFDYYTRRLELIYYV